MWTALLGTVVFAVLLAGGCAWAFMRGMRALEGGDGPDTTSDLRDAEPAPVDAGPRLVWERPVALRTVQQDLAARLADRRREASQVALHRAVRRDQADKVTRFPHDVA